MIDPREAAQRVVAHYGRWDNQARSIHQDALDVARALLAVPSPSGEVQLREALERFVKDFKSSARRSSDGILIASICEDVLEIATAALAAASSPTSGGREAPSWAEGIEEAAKVADRHTLGFMGAYAADLAAEIRSLITQGSGGRS